MESPTPSDAPLVLLVDDQRIIGEAVRRILAEHPEIGFRHCDRGADALALAAELGPTVILQDLVMPDADGIALVRAYRAQAPTRLTPLIVLSANDEATMKAEAFAAGANDYLVKLPDPVELVARIRYHSRGYRAQLRAQAYAESERRRLIAERQAALLSSRDTLIFGLAKLAESRDSETGQHLERIAAYSRLLAEQLRAAQPELDDEWIRNLQIASSLHDIGKVGIPDSVLLKQGKLTPEERLVIERHPVIGAEALDAILERQRDDALLRMARNIAAAHHERWDGRGYPARAAGAAIPLEARIVSVADVYDALTSKRVYKPAMSHEEAVGIIVAGRGTQFDPAIVDALLQCEIVFRSAREQLHDDAFSDGGIGA
ncbi:MAG TPA: response regulator [Phycisphaerales bacterium]|nr:response regulator [Phycisphaerales bacterium]HMP36544.1 response regulator [Phycisphaerales bacterium]